MINLVTRGALALGLALGFGLMAATPASAQVSAAVATCPSGYVCLFEHDNYSGRAVLYTRAQGSLRMDSFNDKTSSVCNTTGVLFKGYQHDQYQGYVMHIQPGYCYPSLRRIQMGPYGAHFNDAYSSIGR